VEAPKQSREVLLSTTTILIHYITNIMWKFFKKKHSSEFYFNVLGLVSLTILIAKVINDDDFKSIIFSKKDSNINKSTIENSISKKDNV
jgi:hypothetical protein